MIILNHLLGFLLGMAVHFIVLGNFFTLESIVHIYKSIIRAWFEYCYYSGLLYIQIFLIKTSELSTIFIDLNWHLDFSQFPTAVMWLLWIFSRNIFLIIVLINFHQCYLNFMNLTTVRDWQKTIIFHITVSQFRFYLYQL